MKENKGQHKGYAVALARKQAAAATSDNNAGGRPLPRVAALSGGAPASHPLRSPLFSTSTAADRPLSSLGNQRAASRPPSSAHRVGCRPATHSAHLVPLLDAHNARAPTASRSMRAAVPKPRAPSMSSSTVIGDPGLDGAEQALQQELQLYDQQLQRLHQRCSATPELSALAPTLVLGVPAASRLSSASVMRSGSAGSGRTSATAVRQLSPPLEQQAAVGATHGSADAHEAAQPAVPQQDQSIVRSVVTATGTGCKDVIAVHAGAALPPGACWTSRGHRVLQLESSCILNLWGRRTPDVTLRITFADAASVPRLVRLEHAPTPTAAFERLGDIKLQAKSLTQLKHLFRLGKSLEVLRCLRITLIGHMAEQDSGAHRVCHMLLTSEHGPQRTSSALSHGAHQLTASGAGPLSARSAQASVDGGAHSRPQLGHEVTPRDATADSGSALLQPLTGHSAARAAAPMPTAAACMQEPPQSAGSSGAQRSASSSGARVPPLPLASMLGGGSGSMGRPASAGAPAPTGSVASEPTLSPAVPKPDEQPEVFQTAREQQTGRGSPAVSEVDFVLLAEEFAAATKAQQDEGAQYEAQWPLAAAPEATLGASLAAAAPPLLLLPTQRCSAVAATLAQLQLTPQQARQAVVVVLDGVTPDLSDAQAATLLDCLPSAEERQVLGSYAGPAEQLSGAEQFMLAVMGVPALEARTEAWLFAARLPSRTAPLAQASGVLRAACAEVQSSVLLQKLLQMAQLAGGFLNEGNRDGAASGFQIDALLKLKAARSTRARSRTLLNFVARQVAERYPDGACLKAALPSAAAAASMDLVAAQTELKGLLGEAWALEAALAAGDGCAAQRMLFDETVLSGLATLQAEMSEAEAAFRQLGSVINGQRATLAYPAAFFGVLHRFAEDLAAAQEENAAADAAADKASSERRSRRTAVSGSPTASTGSKEVSQRSSRRSHTPENVRSSTAQSVEQRGQSAASASMLSAASQQQQQQQQQRRQHTPEPCMSKSAVASLGGSRREGPASPAPANTSVALASLMGAADAIQPGEQQQVGKLSTPVAELLKESARLIRSIDLGAAGDACDAADAPAAGFGSAIHAPSDAAAASHGSVLHDTAATPDSAVVSCTVETERGYSTPRGAAARREPTVEPVGAQPQHCQLGYAAATSTEDEAPAALRAAAQAASDAERVAAAGSLSARGVGQLRQRSLQHLSPTSTPLSSLGRQSSRSSIYSSDAGGSTPGSSLRLRASLMRRSTSPLGGAAQPDSRGLGAAVLDAESGAAAQHNLLTGLRLSPQRAQRAQRPHHAGAGAAAAPDVYAYSSDEDEEGEVAADREEAAAAEAAEVLSQARPPRGFGALHSRASSCDLTFYAPFSMDQLGAAAFQGEQAEAQGLSANFIVSQGSGSAWGPLAAQGRLLNSSAGILRHASVDAVALQHAAKAAALPPPPGTKHVSFSVPGSPRHAAAAPRPTPLNLRGLTGRLQLHQQQQQVRRQPQQQALSPVLEALLSSLPTPAPAPRVEEHIGRTAAELAADDLADMATYSSDQESEWQALEEAQAREEAWRRQEAAEQEQRELALLQGRAYTAAAAHPHHQQHQQQAAHREPTPEWAYPRDTMQEWLSEQQATAGLQSVGRGQPAPATLHLPADDATAAGGDADALAFQQLPPLPSPITWATANMDMAVARLLASAGNTPTGPLGKAAGRLDDLELAGGQALEEQRVAAERQQPLLLEPVMPAPLGEGVRASERMSEGVDAAALRLSVDGPRAMLRPSSASAAALRNSQAAANASLSMDAAAWAAAQQQAAEWDAGAGPVRRHQRMQGLRKLLSRANPL